MVELLERKPLDQITVLEIAQQAGVHRATFFRHYPTRDALLDHVAADQIGKLVELTVPILERSDNLTAVEALLEYVGQHRSVWSALLSGASAAMREALLQHSIDIAQERMGKILSPSVDLSTRYSVGMIFESLSWWLSQNDLKASQHDLAKALHSVLMSIQDVSDW